MLRGACKLADRVREHSEESQSIGRFVLGDRTTGEQTSRSTSSDELGDVRSEEEGFKGDDREERRGLKLDDEITMNCFCCIGHRSRRAI